MKELAFGIDLGGTNTAIGLVDKKGNIYGETIVPTKKYPWDKDFKNYKGDKTTCTEEEKKDGYPAYIKELCRAMHESYDKVKKEKGDFTLIGIGIGAPNANFYKGTVETPANLWKFRKGDPDTDPKHRIFQLAKEISKCFGGSKTLMTNDANAAAIGEMVYGNAKGMDDFVMITLGTGLGSGFVANGRLIYGHDSFAGEFGHVFVEDREKGRQCGCGLKGCLEAYASATGIVITALELMDKTSTPSTLRDIPRAKLTSLMIGEASKEGDKLALEAFEYTGKILGRALADAVAITSPEAIFLFGGLAKSGDLIFEPTRKYMEENLLFAFKDKIKLLPSGLMDKNVGILGAAALIWEEEKPKKKA